MDEQGRICTKCGEWKPWEAFSPHKSQRSGRRPSCKACMADARRSRYAADPSLKQYLQAYRVAHPEVGRKATRKWMKTHPEYNRNKSRRYYHAHKNAISEQRRARYARAKQQGRVLPSTDKETAHAPT
jgi:hypothetical protein